MHQIPTQKIRGQGTENGRKTYAKLVRKKALLIMNGRSKGDEEGRITSIGYGENLGGVLDYVLTRIEDNSAPEWFRGMRIATQEGSDHLPILYRLRWETETEAEEKKDKRKRGKRRLKWREEKELKFKEEWQKLWSQKAQEKHDGTEERWAALHETIHTAARKAGMTTGGPSGGTLDNGWDNGEYKRKRRELFKTLHRFRKHRDWTNKVAYTKCRKELAELRKKLISEWLDEKQKKVAESKNITEWWRAISWFRRNKRHANADIKKEEWLRHFMELLAGEIPEEKHEEKKKTDEKPGANKESSTEEEDDHPLNRPLGDEEIGKAVHNLKSGKAAGEDGISAEFLKEMPDQGIRELIDIVKSIWQEGKIIERWRTAMIYPIHKRGNENEAKNYKLQNDNEITVKLMVIAPN